ncbi:MAG TPA: PH domain-containing protein [Roseiflexaceae bacterium]|nr:PH domain-containing protein [Roseiflexaceae bacterium]
MLAGALAGAGVLVVPLVQAFAGPPQSWPIDLAIYGRLLAVLVLLAIGGALLYRIAAVLTMSYDLDRNGLYINWLGNRAVVPLDQIYSVDLGLTAERLPWRALQWIGYRWGQGKTAEGKRLHLFATQPLSRVLVVYTGAEAYAISPADHEAFVQDLEQRRNLGATKSLTPSFEASRIFLYAFWNDRTVRILLLLAVGLNLLILALLAARYPLLGATVPMRFNAIGQIAEPRPRHQVLFLPLAALGLALLNTVLGLAFYRRQQLGARLLQGASIVVQILFGIAVATIIR